MWHTPCGDRVLQGAEAALVKAAVAGVLADIKREFGGDAHQATYGFPVFDRLPASQRLALLEQVTVHLLTESRDPVELTAANEATIAVLFEHVQSEIERGIFNAGERDVRFRRLVLAAYNSLEDEEGELPQLQPTCDDPEAWHECLELLQSEILWDLDFEMEETFLDVPPEAAEFRKQFLGIDENYYSAAAPDVLNADEIEQTFRHIEGLVGEQSVRTY